MTYDSEVEKTGINSFLSELKSRLGAEVQSNLGKIPVGGNYRPDAYIVASIGKEDVPIVIEVKGHVSNLHQIKPLLNFAKAFDGMSVLVAEAIEESIKEQLKASTIGYYEINNELYFPISFKVEKENNSHNSITSMQGFRAESHVKIMFYFMTYPESLHFTQRELSEKLGISLGTVNSAIKILKEMKLVQIINGRRVLTENLDEIIDRWRIQYSDIEKKKLFLGRFSPISESFYNLWTETDLSKVKGFWGGEPAGSILTDHYLSPGVFTVYTYETSMIDILKKLRLKKDPGGKIEILKAFWPEEINDRQRGIVPEFLVLCDLINSGIDRNRETAQMIKRQLEKKWNKIK
jgi:hypothetical protein